MLKSITHASLLMLAVAVVAGCGNVGEAPRATTGDSVAVAAPQTNSTPTASANGAGSTLLAIDTAASKVSWVAAKVTNSHDGGFRNFNGTVSVNGDQVAGAKINIDANSIYSDNEKLTGHLKSDDFFATGQHPQATFEVTNLVKIDTVPNATHMVTGNLTMRGKSKGISFPATVAVTPDGATAQADFIIDRQLWDIKYAGAPDDLIRNDVRIKFDIKAKKGAM